MKKGEKIPLIEKTMERKLFGATGTETCIHIARDSLPYRLAVIEPKHTLEIVIESSVSIILPLHVRHDLQGIIHACLRRF